jgi:hypothetical protein
MAEQRPRPPLPDDAGLTISSPANGPAWGPSLPVSGYARSYDWNENAWEWMSIPTTVDIYVDNVELVSIPDVEGPFGTSVNIPTPGLKTIRVNGGREIEERTVDLKIDTEVPALDITEPQEGERLGGRGPTFDVRIAGTATDRPTDHPSGIKAVQYRMSDSEAFRDVAQVRVEGNTWHWHQDIQGLALGTHTIQIQASDNINPRYTFTTRTITFVDTGAPEINITSPETSPHIVTWSEGGISVEIVGTASDLTTGVQSVEWRLDGEALWHTATKDSETWSNWRFTAHLPAPGLYDIAVRATDGAGNPSTDTVQLDVAVPFELEDVDFAAYLDDLMIFTRRRVRATGNAQLPLDKAHLTTTFYQRFDRLTEPSFRPFAVHTVAQVRIAVEVLRRFLHNDDQFPHYCETAYYALLANFGTSYTELRLARKADPETRKALANRLGLPWRA